MRARAGVVLPVVILVLLVVELLAIGAIALAYQQHRLATDRVLAVRAQLAARAGATDAAWRMSTSRYQPMPPRGVTPDSSGTLDAHATFSANVERLTPSLFLIRSRGFGGPDSTRGARASAGLLMAMTDISEIARQFDGALSIDGGLVLLGNAQVDAMQPAQIPIGWSPQDCSTWLSFPAAVPGVVTADPSTVITSATATIDGQPPILGALPTPGLPPRLGSLDFATVQSLADRLEAGQLTLAPAAMGTQCDTAAVSNWGAPLDPAHPCSTYFPLIFAPGDLTISAGAGQGVLVVAGDLTLGAGSQFFGLVLAGGRLVAGPGARITGAVRAGSSTQPSVLADAALIRSDCAIGRALTQSPALNRPQWRTTRSWLPIF